MKYFFEELESEIKNKKPKNVQEILKLRDKLVKKHRVSKIPSLFEIIVNVKYDLIKNIKIKPSRTIAGVAPVAIMTKPIKCPKNEPCIYCPGGPDSFFGDIPQSYTGKEPATRRAIRNKYDPYLQIFNRLEQFSLLNQSFDKVELIIMGGTFPSFDIKYQDEFIKYAFKALNDFSDLFFNKNKFDFVKFKKFFLLPGDINKKERIEEIHKKLLKLKGKTSLEKEQKRNEKAKIRCVALCIETRPDFSKKEHIDQMLKFGFTKV
jgi:elongator complex protein 3